MPSATDKNSTQPGTTSRKGSAALEGNATTPEGGYRAKRYAVKYDPPCIFLEYEDTCKKRRVRAVKLVGVQANVDVDKLTRKVIRSFPRKLEATSVKYDQVRKLVGALIDYLAKSEPVLRNGSLHGPSRLGPGGGGSASHDGVPSSRVSDSASGGSDRAPAANGGGSFSSPLPTMSPRVDHRGPTHGRHGGPLSNLAHSAGYRDSVESSMSRFSTSTGGSSDDEPQEDLEEEVEEEEEEDDDLIAGGGRRAGGGLLSALDDLEREMEDLGPDGRGPDGSSFSVSRAPLGVGLPDSRDSSFLARNPLSAPSVSSGPPPPTPALRAGSAVGEGPAAAGGKSRFAAEAEKLTIGLEVTEDLDLNRVTEVELRMAKLAMESDFRKNQLRPGDPGYVYDKQAEFGPPTEDNDWDDSGDEDDDDGRNDGSEEPEVDWDDIQKAVRKATSVVVQVPAGAPPLPKPASGAGNGTANGKAGTSPYNSNDWP